MAEIIKRAPTSDSEAQQLFRKLDFNHDHDLSLEEFRDMARMVLASYLGNALRPRAPLINKYFFITYLSIQQCAHIGVGLGHRLLLQTAL